MRVAAAALTAIAFVGACRTDDKVKAPCSLAGVLLRYPSYVESSCTKNGDRLRCMIDSPAADIPDTLSCENALFVPLRNSTTSDPCVALTLARTRDQGDWVLMFHSVTWRNADAGIEGGGMLLRSTEGGKSSLSERDANLSPELLASDDYVRYVLNKGTEHCVRRQ